MKEIIIIIIILIIIYTGAIYSQRFLDNTSDLLVGKLEELKEGIEDDKMTEQQMRDKSDEIYGEWEDINESWSIIVLHDEIDLIETSLIKMKSKIKTGKIDDCMEDLDTSIFLVKHIKEKEKTNLKNIF